MCLYYEQIYKRTNLPLRCTLAEETERNEQRGSSGIVEVQEKGKNVKRDISFGGRGGGVV
jgi:hypothetical protein